MPANLVRLELATGLLALLAVLLGTYVAQRLIYRIRTRRLREIETIPFRPFPEWTCAIIVGMLLVAIVQSISLTQSLSPYLDAEKSRILKELDVVRQKEGYTSVLIYPPRVGEAEASGYYEELVQGPGEQVLVELEVVRFSGWLRLLGQPDVARLIDVVTEERSLKTQPVETPSWLLRLLVSQREKIMLVHDLDSRDFATIAISMSPQGEPMIQAMGK